jgi:hypothetical protein
LIRHVKENAAEDEVVLAIDSGDLTQVYNIYLYLIIFYDFVRVVVLAILHQSMVSLYMTLLKIFQLMHLLLVCKILVLLSIWIILLNSGNHELGGNGCIDNLADKVHPILGERYISGNVIFLFLFFFFLLRNYLISGSSCK